VRISLRPVGGQAVRYRGEEKRKGEKKKSGGTEKTRTKMAPREGGANNLKKRKRAERRLRGDAQPEPL